MRITTFFGLIAASFCLLVAGLVALTLHNIEKNRQWDERSELAHASLQEHLLLQSKVFQLLKQYGDALIIGDLDRGSLEQKLTADIAQSINRIRTIIGAEIELVGEQEIEELLLLSMVEAKIAEVIRALNQIPTAGETAPPIGELVDLLDQTIDQELYGLIADAIQEERDEVAQTRAEARAFRDMMQVLSWGAAALALLILLSGIWSYSNLLHVPFGNLMAAISAYGRGDFSRDIEPTGGAELRKMSGVLSNMAVLLRKREAEQKQENELLERRVAERTQELERLLGQIEMSESNRRRMMADISHELRTPLTIIRGEAEVALRGKDLDPEMMSDAFARIRDSARHTAQIVDDMLLVARHEAGELRLDLKETDLRQIISEAQDMFETQVTVQINTDDTLANVDRLRMRQCLLSVLHNAERYGGPDITITVDDNDDHLVLMVSDNGPGMSDDDKLQAFERFFRGSNAAQSSNAGTGLGLPIVRAIMEAHDGTATLSDAQSGGLQVVLTLPRNLPLSTF